MIIPLPFPFTLILPSVFQFPGSDKYFSSNSKMFGNFEITTFEVVQVLFQLRASKQRILNGFSTQESEIGIWFQYSNDSQNRKRNGSPDEIETRERLPERNGRKGTAPWTIQVLALQSLPKL
ncbi:hypothetical protein C1646_753227 [Rhizophagus diaphanus]|nr:hypothetical protein C1646_753227 [Rhizophagus diaphanus] [Rhizophagus sp. MUCL 43196]